MSARLGREVRRRRSELGLTQAALADRGKGHFSLATLSRIERGKARTYTGPVLAALDRALGWEVGHAQGILDDEQAGGGDSAVELAAAYTDERFGVMLSEMRGVLDEMRRTPSWHREALAIGEAMNDEARAVWFAVGRRLR